MIRRWLIRRALRTPYLHLAGYMDRWWLVPYRATIVHADGETHGTGPVGRRRPLAWLLQRLGIAVRVHHILRSDSGRVPHDHPWPYLTVILRGGYTEVRYDGRGFPTGRKWHGPGSVLFRRANSWHRLDLPEGRTAWTLFLTGRKEQTWGFMTLGGIKVPYYEHKEGT